MSDEIIKIGINDKVITLKDEQLNEFLAIRQELIAQDNENAAKTAARQSALAKLAELGLTEAEIAAL